MGSVDSCIGLVLFFAFRKRAHVAWSYAIAVFDAVVFGIAQGFKRRALTCPTLLCQRSAVTCDAESAVVVLPVGFKVPVNVEVERTQTLVRVSDIVITVRDDLAPDVDASRSWWLTRSPLLVLRRIDSASTQVQSDR